MSLRKSPCFLNTIFSRAISLSFCHSEFASAVRACPERNRRESAFSDFFRRLSFGGISTLSRFAAVILLLATSFAQTPNKQQVLWQKLEASIAEVDRNLDGVLGVAIEDLTTGQKYLLHADEVFPQASSIKIAVLAELYHQAQQGKLKLTDLYTVQSSDLVPDSDIMGGLTPGVTRITLRDLATMMVAVSDNSATNVLIDKRPYIICAMTTYLRRERDGEEAIGKISLETYRMFDRLARASEYGRVISPGNSSR